MHLSTMRQRAEEKKKKDKHGGDEPDKKPEKAAENKECDEKEGEKVSV